MKKIILTLVFCAIAYVNLHAQYVTILDVDFRDALKVLYPTCFNAGGQMPPALLLALRHVVVALWATGMTLRNDLRLRHSLSPEGEHYSNEPSTLNRV